MIATAFDGKHRKARVERFDAEHLTAKARASKKARRKQVARSRRRNR